MRSNIPREIGFGASESTGLFSAAFMRRGYWRRKRQGSMSDALREAAEAFMNRSVSKRARMRAALELLDPGEAANRLDPDYCHALREAREEKAAMAVHFPGMLFDIHKLKRMESEYPGLGTHLLSLLEGAPVSVATPFWTLESIQSWFWDGGEDETWSDFYEDGDSDIVTLATVKKIFPDFTLDYAALGDVADYRGGWPNDARLRDDAEKLKSALESWNTDFPYERRLGFTPDGVDIPGIVTFFGGRDHLTQRMIDYESEMLGQVTGSAYFSGYVFCIDSDTDMNAVFDEIERVIEMVNGVVDLLLAIEKHKVGAMKAPLWRNREFMKYE